MADARESRPQHQEAQRQQAQCQCWNADPAHQRHAGQARAKQFTSAYQSAAGEASFTAFSARWRAGCGLAPLTVEATQRYVTPDLIRSPLGEPLAPAVQAAIYAAWCAGRLYGVLYWTPQRLAAFAAEASVSDGEQPGQLALFDPQMLAALDPFAPDPAADESRQQP